MNQPKIALFFALLFSAFIMTPSVMMVLDKDYDIAVYFDGNEEEEKKGNESPKDAEDKLLPRNFFDGDHEYVSSSKSYYHYIFDFDSEFFELNDPPPERSI